MKLRHFGWLGLGLAWAWSAQQGWAQTNFSWTNVNGGSYHSASNWSPAGGPPIFDDHAIFNVNGTYGVTFTNAGTQTLDFQVRQGTVTFSYLNTTAVHNWSSTSTSKIGPNAGDAATTATLNLINMSNNPMRGGDLIIGHTAGKTGTLNIFSNGRWQGFAGADVTVGSQGTGNLNVSTTGILQNSSISGENFVLGELGGAGNASISGLNAAMNVANVLTLGQGAGSLGKLTISNQGRVQVADSIFIGVGSELDNLVNVIGSNSKLQLGSDTTQIGYSGKGRLRVIQGAIADSGQSVTDLGNATGSSGELEIDGAGSQFVSGIGNNSVLTIGRQGSGVVAVSNGGLLSVGGLNFGKQATGNGTLTVSGAGSKVQLNAGATTFVGDIGQGAITVSQQGQFITSGGLVIGNTGNGQLQINSGGLVQSSSGSIGQGPSGSQATVLGAGSAWNMTAGLDVGWHGQANLDISGGGNVNSAGGRLGILAGSTGIAAITGNNSSWNTTGSSLVMGQSGTGLLTLLGGGQLTTDHITLGLFSGSVGNLSILDAGSKWWANETVNVGSEGSGFVSVAGGGGISVVSPSNFNLGASAPGMGQLRVAGNGSHVQLGANSNLAVGRHGTGEMLVEQGGLVTSGLSVVGFSVGSTGQVIVRHAGSNWTTSGNADVGRLGTGTVSLQSGGQATAANWFVGSQSGSDGTVVVTGAQTKLSAVQNLIVGGNANGEGGSGSLSVGAGATVDIGNTLRLYSQGVVNLNGGKISLGQFDPQQGLFQWNQGTVEFKNNTVLTSGLLDALVGTSHTLGNQQTLATTASGGLVIAPGYFQVDGGKVLAQQFTNIGNTSIARGSVQVAGQFLNDVQGQVVVSGAGQLTVQGHWHNNGELIMAGAGAVSRGGSMLNTGSLSGTGRLEHAITNQGLIQVDTGDQLRVLGTGASLSNSGQIQLSGGRLQVAGLLENQELGFITGHGVLDTSSLSLANTGLHNFGTVAVSGDGLDVYGDVRHVGAARWLTSGLATTTFWDDVEHNGLEIRTALGSSTVFYGAVTGAGPFTGIGAVLFEGDLKPGNSPANVLFAGDVSFGQSASVLFELGGDQAGLEYDQLTINGLVSLDGQLLVHLISGFRPLLGSEFMLINNRGLNDFVGTFDGIAQGDLWWSGERRFEIDYFGGDGNDLVITAIPEPRWLMLAGAMVLACIAGRRSRLPEGRMLS